MRPPLQAASLALLVSASLVGCRAHDAGQGRSNSRMVIAQPARVEDTPPGVKAAPRRASGRVTIRLASLSGAREIETVDAAGARHVLRRADGRLTVDGEATAEFALEARPGASVAVASARYPGTVRVRTDSAGEWLVENEVDLEDYVRGVVAKEMGFGDVPREAWRAQAIAARSYALAALDERGARRADPYLFDGVRDQAYIGCPQPRNERERKSVDALTAAVRSTSGLALMENHRYLDARYHASCGGRTAEGSTVFPELRSECFQGAECAPCAKDPNSGWEWTASGAALDQFALRAGVGAHVKRIHPTRVDASQRWIEVDVVGDRTTRRMRFEELRRELGRDKLRSARILDTWPKGSDEIRGGMLFRGAGSGHGVGLCQRGAQALAREGWSAERILAHYYGGASIEERR